MSIDSKLPVKTASREQSVWRYVVQNKFRMRVVELENASREVPRDPKVYTQAEWLAFGSRICGDGHLLPFGVEQQFADDLAFIAAAEEGVNAVSAVGLEEVTGQRGILVRLAANEGVRENVQKTFETIFGLLKQCASRTLARELCAKQVFEQVMILSRTRIHSRLQSTHWKKPAYYRSDPKPLHQELKKFSRWLRTQHPKCLSDGTLLNQQLENLGNACKHIDSLEKDTEEELTCLTNIVRESYAICTSNGNCTIEETVSAYGYDPKQVCINKQIRQVDKIGRYWGSCYFMAEASRKYKDIFTDMKLRILPPYEGIESPISFKGGLVSCYVHAEIQLLTFYGLKPDRLTSDPRILGVSKSACYLCDLFIKKHGQFFITKTHGRLHDQWTVPDLAEFSPTQRSAYQRILAEMRKELELETVRAQFSTNRKYPQGSWLSLPAVLPMSLATSNAGTIVPEASEHTTMTPRILSPAPTLRQNSPLLQNSISQLKQIPEIFVSNTTNITRSPSSDSVTQPNYPIHRKITAKSPFHVISGKLSVEVGLEGPGQHEITVHLVGEGQTAGDIIEVGEMIPGKEMFVQRNKAENEVVLTLRYGTDNSVQIVL